jgi:hypothetical protein
LYLRHNDVYILALTRNNANAMLTFKFMTSVRATQGVLGALVQLAFVAAGCLGQWWGKVMVLPCKEPQLAPFSRPLLHDPCSSRKSRCVVVKGRQC